MALYQNLGELVCNYDAAANGCLRHLKMLFIITMNMGSLDAITHAESSHVAVYCDFRAQ